MAHLKKFVLLLVFAPFSADCNETVNFRSTKDQPMLRMLDSGCSEDENIEKCLEGELIQNLDKILNMTSITLAEGIDFVQTSELNQSKYDFSYKNLKFSDVFWDKMSLLMSSRAIRVHLTDYNEGRGKKIRKQYIALGLLIAAILATLKFQALSFFVGKVLLISNIAILTTGFLAFKLLLPASTTKNTRSAVVYVEPSINPHFDHIPTLRD